MKFCNYWGQIPAEGNSLTVDLLEHWGSAKKAHSEVLAWLLSSWCRQEGFRITERCCCAGWEQYRALLVCHTQRGLVGLDTGGTCSNPQWTILKIEFIFLPTVSSFLSPLAVLQAASSPSCPLLSSHSLFSNVFHQPFCFCNHVYCSSLPSCCRHTPLPPCWCCGFEFAGVGLQIPGTEPGPCTHARGQLSDTLRRLSPWQLLEHIPMLVSSDLLVQASSVTPSAHLQKSLVIL